MGLLMRRMLVASLTLLCPGGRALDWQFSVDARFVLADATRSYLDGGLGKFRYNDGATAQVGRARLALNQHLGDSLRLHIDASTWGDKDKHPFDLTEAFIEYRSYPHNAWRTRLRLGAFYPAASLENRASGWETPYSINPSALTSWLGEEIRSIGVEASIDHLGTKRGNALDWGLFSGLFCCNDPAGTLIATHGFALSDRQTTLNGRVGPDANVPVNGRQLFYEIDRRAGYYAGANLKYLDRLEVRAMHYDNRADPTQPKPSIRDYAWLTKFNTVGIRYETSRELTMLAQWLKGDTTVAPYGLALVWNFDSWNILASERWGAHGLTLRYDRFTVSQTINAFGPAAQRDHGNAWTLAYIYDPDESHWRFVAEATRADSLSTDREALLGAAPQAIESKLELSARYALSGRWP